MTTGTVTTVGMTKLLAAQIAGQAFSPNIVKVSSSVLSPTGAETVLPNIVYTAPSSSVTQYALSPGVVRTVLYMDTTVGNFTVGSLGLFTSDDTLFAIGVFPGAGQKIASSSPQVVGNIRTLYLDVDYQNVSETFQVEVSDISTIALGTMLANLSGEATARQIRTALNNAGQLGLVNSAVLADGYDKQVLIDWQTCAAVGPGSALLNFIAAVIGVTDGGAALLATALQLPA